RGVRRSLTFATLKAAALAGLFLAYGGNAFAAGLAIQPGPISARPTAHVARISASEAPKIDGELSDPAWAKATVIADFRQREPDPGRARAPRAGRLGGGNRDPVQQHLV